MRTYLSINTTVPAEDNPGTPVIVFYSNGDWEIAFLGDTDYIESGNSYYVGYVTAIDALTDLRFEFDFEAVDSDGEVAHLFVEGYTFKDAPSELVLVLYDIGETDLMERETAEHMIAAEDSGVFNFIPYIDLIDELRRFVAIKRHEMFESFEDVPEGFGDEDGEDD